MEDLANEAEKLSSLDLTSSGKEVRRPESFKCEIWSTAAVTFSGLSFRSLFPKQDYCTSALHFARYGYLEPWTFFQTVLTDT